MTYGLDFITVFSTFIVLFAGIVGIGALPWSELALRRSADAWSVAVRLPLAWLALAGDSLARTQWALGALQQYGLPESR